MSRAASPTPPRPLPSSPGSPPPSVRGRRTREALIAAARTVFERDGYLEARITDITAEAAVATGSFYTHFDSKEQVFSAVMAELQDEMLHPNLGEHTPSGDPVAAIRRAHLAYLVAYREHAKLMGLVEQFALANPAFLAVRLARAEAFADRNAALIVRLQEQGLADADLDPITTAHALNAMASRMAYMVFVLGHDLELEPLADTLTLLWANALGLSRDGRHGMGPRHSG